MPFFAFVFAFAFAFWVAGFGFAALLASAGDVDKGEEGIASNFRADSMAATSQRPTNGL